MAAVVAQNCIFGDWDQLALFRGHDVGDGPGFFSYLIEAVEQLRDQRRPWTGRSEGIPQSKMGQIADESRCALGGKGEGVAPEIPLEGDDGEAGHADPYHGQGGFPSRQAGVEEAQARDHDDDHGGSHDDVGLVSRGKPLIEIFLGYEGTLSAGFLWTSFHHSPFDHGILRSGGGAWWASDVGSLWVRGRFGGSRSLTGIAATEGIGAIEGGRSPNP